jgi:intracellular septation protein A
MSDQTADRSGSVGETTGRDADDGRVQPRPVRSFVATVLFDLAVPLALYYILRAFGVSEVMSLIISAVVPGISVAYQLVTQRRLDGFAILVGTMLLLSIGVSFITGSPRFLLAKDGWLTAVGGIWILVTLFVGKPFIYLAVRPLFEGRMGPPDESWDDIWNRLGLFRRVWRVLTVIWGVGLLIDAVIRVVMAYTLPIDLVPGLGGGLYGVMYFGLQVISQIYFARSGLMEDPEFVGADGQYVPGANNQPASTVDRKRGE